MLRRLLKLHLVTLLIAFSVPVTGALGAEQCPRSKPVSTWSNCFGIFAFVNGGKYAGEWVDGKMQGYGTYTNSFGQVRVGEFKDGRLNGRGSVSYTDGSKEIGEWKENLLHGQGTLNSASGRKYVGEFKNGKKTGNGTLTHGNGSVEIWKNGKIFFEKSMPPSELFAPATLDENAQLDNDIIQKFKEAIAKNDFETAFGIMEPLARQGHPVAQVNLGAMYKKGHGVEKHDAIAVMWYRLAADQGNLVAQFNLANAYYRGVGVEESRQNAVELYNLAARKGHRTSRRVLEAMFQIGLRAAKNGDFSLTFREWKPLAEHGMAKAQINLGLMYENGDGVTSDLKSSFNWYLRAAKQGLRKAQFLVGVAYREGKGSQQDLKQSNVWFGRAAKQGDTNAQLIISAALALGETVPRNLSAALYWAYIAKFEGDDDAAPVIKLLKSKVPNDRLLKIQKLAKECVEKRYKGC